MFDTWPVRRQSYGYLPSLKASPPIGWYQIMLLGDTRHVCVNNLSRVAVDSEVAGIRTGDLLIASLAPYHYATEPHNVKAIIVKISICKLTG